MQSARGSRGLLPCASLLNILNRSSSGSVARCLMWFGLFLAVAKSQLLPCAGGVTNRTISNSAQAFDLTEVLMCSGGQFEVTWVGEVLLTRTIAVSDGTSLKVLGSSSGGSVIDGEGLQHQLFNVSEGSTLELQGLSLMNGALVRPAEPSPYRARLLWELWIAPLSSTMLLQEMEVRTFWLFLLQALYYRFNERCLLRFLLCCS